MVLELRKEKRTRRMRGGSSGNTGTIPKSSLIKKTAKKSRRKTRSKTRKPKYLSLRLQFSSDQKGPESSEMPSSTVSTTTTATTSSTNDHHQPQLNLFPLHPENLVEEKDAHDENMAYLFSAADGGATTLTGLLGAAACTSSSDGDNKNHSTTTLSPSASLTYAYGRRDRDSEEEVALVRTAMRNKEREPSEERWVRYSEVVERRAEDQEVSSCAADDLRYWRRNLRLSLKLDYQEILNAWSDKGPLYIYSSAAYSPQTVPDIHDDFLASQLSNGISDGWGNSEGCVWRVPEFGTSKENEQAPQRLIKVKEELQQEQAVVAGEELNLKVGQREASVQRYKEKRQNRLFSKKIRYQVRKLNAEKRPRLKGRFVKRN